jgi:general secretion pathway protein C
VSTAGGFDQLKSLDGLMRVLTERGPSLLAAALIVALALDSALILTRALSGAQALPPPSASPLSAAPPHRGTNPQLLLATIVNAHVFGSAAAQAGGPDAPPTSMPLVLTGVIADKDPARGQAIIGANAAAAKLYSVNAVIPGGARLHAVYRDRVLLERNGALETLALPRTALGGVAPSSSAPPLPTAATLRQNPSLLAGLVRIQPVFTQGKLNGYRIFPGGPNGTAAFNQLGLRPGDLVLAVNGTTLEDPAHAMEVLQTLSSSGSATITVSRNGSAQEVNLNLATLNDLGQGGGGSQPSTPPAPQPAAGPFGGRRHFGATFQPNEFTDGSGSDGTIAGGPEAVWSDAIRAAR